MASTAARAARSAKQSPDGLSSKKLAALISLYHEADTFITKDNLDEAIDKAFLQAPRLSAVFREEQTYYDLQTRAVKRQGMPKTAEWLVADDTAFMMPDKSWREYTKTRREIAVAEALYGTSHARKPGLEALKDHAERLEKSLKQEREKREQ
ncbi:hypothetical protein OE88DRAFT_1731686 [Heliocybe sulcata]|uniref:Uncharacterized protein n=1 Tax=Heliocybe sulcata TaxID=5364 RepID=A0A5C3NEA2_9AGAM|nr:hypothetical protein OE88DRAFT_1731686 [Heliocybe sulcata]